MSWVDEYLKSKQYAWAPTTQKAEQSRLKHVAKVVNYTPDAAYEYIQSIYKPYAVNTAWTRLCDFYDFLLEQGYKQGVNVFRQWAKKNRKVFKNVYEKRQPEISYEEARRQVESIEDSRVREECLRLLNGGLRIAERHAVSHGRVYGKGGKSRPYLPDTQPNRVSEYQIRKHLSALGMRPHDLRKIFARKLYERGFRELDIAYIMGWESFETAKSYIRPSQDEYIKQKVQEEI